MDTNKASVMKNILSSYQKAIWFEECCMYPEKMTNNFRGHIETGGNVDIDFFKNDSLKNRLIDRIGEPYLAILTEVDYKIPFLNFSIKENPDYLYIDC